VNRYSLYVPGRSWIYRLDPRTKLAGVGLTFVLILMFNDPRYLAVLLLVVMGSVVSAGRPARALLGFGYTLIPVLLATVVMWPLFERSGAVVLSWGWITVTDKGLLFALAMGLRIIVPIIATLGLFLTTRRRDLITGLVKIGLPYQAGFGITIAFGLVPMLVGTAHTIVEAQRARALEINKGSVFARLRKSSSLIVPLMIAAIGSIQNLAFSMDSRAYGASGARTYLHAPRITTLDRILLISGGLILAAAIALRATGHGAIFPGRL